MRGVCVRACVCGVCCLELTCCFGFFFALKGGTLCLLEKRWSVIAFSSGKTKNPRNAAGYPALVKTLEALIHYAISHMIHVLVLLFFFFSFTSFLRFAPLVKVALTGKKKTLSSGQRCVCVCAAVGTYQPLCRTLV